MRLEYWQGLRRRPRLRGCGWWSAGPPCGGRAGRGAYLARKAGSVAAGGVMGGGWCCTLAAFLGARWRPVSGLVAWWLVLVCPCPLRGPYGRRVAGAGVVLIGCAWSLPPLRFGPLQPPPLRLLVHLSSAPAAVALVVAVVALRWWRGQIVNELARLALLALSRCGGRGGSRTRAAVGGPQWSRPWPLRAVVISPPWRCTP